MGSGFTIAEVAERTGLSTHTLRYYEQVGLIDGVSRSRSGRRRYSSADIEHVRLLTTLRMSGMAVADVRRYVELSRADQDGGALREFLLEHRRQVCAQLDRLRAAIQEIDARLPAPPAY